MRVCEITGILSNMPASSNSPAIDIGSHSGRCNEKTKSTAQDCGVSRLFQNSVIGSDPSFILVFLTYFLTCFRPIFDLFSTTFSTRFRLRFRLNIHDFFRPVFDLFSTYFRPIFDYILAVVTGMQLLHSLLFPPFAACHALNIQSCWFIRGSRLQFRVRCFLGFAFRALKCPIWNSIEVMGELLPQLLCRDAFKHRFP